MATARVTLKKSKSYSVDQRRWVQDVPQVISGDDEIKQYEANGYFHVKRLEEDRPSVSPQSPLGKRLVRRRATEAPVEA